MRVLAGAWLFACACAAVPPPPAPAARVEARPSGCREDIPDCVAACALRETSRTDYVEWFDRRCAAAILGRDADAAAGSPPQAAHADDLLDTR